MDFGPVKQMSEREALLWGNIHHFYFPKLLVYLEAAKKTGILTVTCNRVIKRIFLRDGVPTAARSNLKLELIGAFLVAQKVITREQKEQALQAQRGTKNSLGAILFQEEMITAQDLFTYARRQFLTILFSLFGLQEGGFRFDERPLPKDLYCYKVSFSNMMLFGIRQISDSKTLGRMIGDLSRSPVPTDRFMEYEKLTFAEEELSVIRRVDGVRSVEVIVERTGFERLTALRTLLVLLCHGLVKFPFQKAPEVEEDVVDLALTTRTALGMTSFESKDENEEKAVAGNDFLVSPEGIYVSGTGEAEPDRLPETTEETAVEEQGSLPLETSDTLASIPLDAAEVTDLNNGDVDETFAGPAGKDPGPAEESFGIFAPTSGRTPSEEDSPEEMPMPLGSLPDEDTECLSGPVARAYRTRLKETMDPERKAHSDTTPVQELDDAVPSLQDETVEEPVAPEGTFPDEEALARMALSEEESLNVPNCGIGAAAEDGSAFPESGSPFDCEEERNAILSVPEEETEEKGKDGEDSGEEEVVALSSVPEKKSGAGLFYLFLLVLAVGLGALSMTPWREDLMDRLLSPPPMVAADRVPTTPEGGAVPENDREKTREALVQPSAVPAVSDVAEEKKGADSLEMPEGADGEPPVAIASTPLVADAETALPSPNASDAPVLPERDAVLPAEVPAAVKAVSPTPATWEEQMGAWRRRLREIPPAQYTLQVEIGGNLAFLRQDLSHLPPELDAMLVPYQVKDWKAYTLLVGVFESRAEGRALLQKLPPAIQANHPMVKTLETIQKGLLLPE